MQAADYKRASQRLTTAVTAAALQAGFYWVVLHETYETRVPARSSAVEVTLISMTRPRTLPAVPPRAKARAPAAEPRRQLMSAHALRPRKRPLASQSTGHPPPDRRQAIQREVRAEESLPSAGKLDFNFPARRPAVPSQPVFGWDAAVIHRVEALPTGGILINLSDHCALVIYGFMLVPGCRIGHIPANGHLLDHVRDPGNDRLGGLP